MSTRPAFASFCVCLTLAVGTRPAGAQTAATTDGQTAGTVATPASSSSSRKLTAPKFKDLFTPLPGDFKRVTTRPNFWLLGIGAAGTLAARPFDQKIAGAQWGGSGAAFTPGTLVGSFYVQTGGALATYAIGRATGKPGLATVGAELFRAQMVTEGMTQAIKLATHRTRPDGTTLSFPSGHAASAFATATVLQSHYGWKAGVPAYAMASWIAASRMQTSRHYLSDVVAGATLGILAGRSITIGHGSARFAVAPMAAPGGAGVSFTRVVKK
jgi:membrane-associated phospholipid phosphatase